MCKIYNLLAALLHRADACRAWFLTMFWPVLSLVASTADIGYPKY